MKWQRYLADRMLLFFGAEHCDQRITAKRTVRKLLSEHFIRPGSPIESWLMHVSRSDGLPTLALDISRQIAVGSTPSAGRGFDEAMAAICICHGLARGDSSPLAQIQTKAIVDLMVADSIDAHGWDLFWLAESCLREGNALSAINILGILAKSNRSEITPYIKEKVLGERDLLRRYTWAILSRLGVSLSLSSLNRQTFSAKSVVDIWSRIDKDTHSQAHALLSAEHSKPFDPVSRDLTNLMLSGYKLEPQDTTKILLLFACPHSLRKVRLAEQEREIRSALAKSESNGSVILTVRNGVRVDDLRQAIIEERPDIVHVSSHGDSEKIILCGEGDDWSPLYLESLSKFLELHKVRCVILNSCQSAKWGKSLGNSITIAMEEKLSDHSAIKFSKWFYQSIGAGLSIVEAFEEARLVVNMHRLRDFRPKLYLP